MAEDGLIWRGSHNRLRPTVWKYSQFERDILDCALHLMIQVGKVRVSARRDPVVVCRVLSAAVSNSTSLASFLPSDSHGIGLSEGELGGRQRGGDGELVGRFRGWHAAHQVAGLAEDTAAVLQDEETGQVRAVLGVLGRVGHHLPCPRPPVPRRDQLRERPRHAEQPHRRLLRGRRGEGDGGAEQRLDMASARDLSFLFVSLSFASFFFAGISTCGTRCG